MIVPVGGSGFDRRSGGGESADPLMESGVQRLQDSKYDDKVANKMGDTQSVVMGATGKSWTKDRKPGKIVRKERGVSQ